MDDFQPVRINKDLTLDLGGQFNPALSNDGK